MAVLMALGPAVSATSTAAASRATSTKPNIVLILTDDQRWDTLWAMPNVQTALVNHGVTFSNGFVVNSLCCPSRTSILTGQYSHSTGVYTNGPPLGGFPAFHQDESTIATWLHGAGYRTGLFGKYLNSYEGTYIPPGWDQWLAFTPKVHYYDYQLNRNGDIESHGDAPADYSTDVVAASSVDFIRSTPASEPLLLYMATCAPHDPPTPAPRHRDTFGNLKPWRPPSYDEPDVSDKPAWLRHYPQMDDERRAWLDAERRNQYRTLLAVDDAVGAIVDALADTGRLSNTMIVFTSDNGYAWGEHRWWNKQTAYEESIRVPFVVRYDPMVHAARTDQHLVANIDLAPTFAAAAGVASPGAEGRSLLPIMAAASGALWRSAFLVEHVNLRWPTSIPNFCAVRSTTYLYVNYATHEEELYLLAYDPYELRNRARDPTVARTLIAARKVLQNLCRPPPPDWTYGVLFAAKPKAIAAPSSPSAEPSIRSPSPTRVYASPHTVTMPVVPGANAQPDGPPPDGAALGLQPVRSTAPADTFRTSLEFGLAVLAIAMTAMLLWSFRAPPERGSTTRARAARRPASTR